MVGDFSVGKTSLVSRFVQQTFSEKYLTTVGVKIDTKIVNSIEGVSVKLILWDIAGNDVLTTATKTYLRGAAGFFLVVDGTRFPTWQSAIQLHQEVTTVIGEKPFILLLNKTDLEAQWEIDQSLIEAQTHKGWQLIRTSAKTGLGVEEAFLQLSMRMID